MVLQSERLSKNFSCNREPSMSALPAESLKSEGLHAVSGDARDARLPLPEEPLSLLPALPPLPKSP